MDDSGIDYLVAEGVIGERVTRLKSGKEADVYVVSYAGKTVAAKVYKNRAHRSFKNDSIYKEGRAVRNSRSQRAMQRGSRFGQEQAEAAWKSAEVDALYKLHHAGVRVPTPVMYIEGVLLMELVLGADGNPAPRVIDTQLTVEQANAAYHDMLGQLVRMLACDLIHGDLSPYNVLWGAAGPTIIDFPQIISAAHNRSSEMLFIRDARNILGHFARIDESLHQRATDPHEIWRAYVRRELTPDFLPLARPRPAYVAPPPRGVRPPQHRPPPPPPRPHDRRPPPRGPEVIVRMNRAPQAPPVAPREDHGVQAQTVERERVGPRRRRRGRR
jgi:RIO kinase 1